VASAFVASAFVASAFVASAFVASSLPRGVVATAWCRRYRVASAHQATPTH